jgi:hypothetical protein
MECPRCNSTVDHAANFCPECGLGFDSLSDIDARQTQSQNNGQTGMAADDTSSEGPESEDNRDNAGAASHRRDDTNTQEGPSSTPNRSSNQTSTTNPGVSGQSRENIDGKATGRSANTGPFDAAERSHENDRSREQTSPSPDEANLRSRNDELAHNPEQQDTTPPTQAAEPHPSNAGRQAPSNQRANQPRPDGTANERTSGQQQGKQSTSRRGNDVPAPTGTPQGSQPTESAFSWPTVTATIYGAVAFAVSFGLTYALHTIELATKENGFAATSDSQFAPEWLGSVEQFEVVGWLFYSAHTVPIEMTMNDETQTFNVLEGAYAAFAAIKSDASTTQLQEISTLMFFGSYDATLNALGIESSSEAAALLIPKLAYNVVPGIVALVAGYYLVGRISTGRQLTDGQAATSGALVGIAYAAIGVIAASTVFSFAGDGGMIQSIQPQMDAAALLPLVAYPAMAAAVGGFLAR